LTVKERPILQTEHLVLRPFNLDDAPVVQLLAGDFRIADMTLLIPHPYEDGVAEEWIGTHRKGFEEGRLLTLAIIIRDSNELAGAISLNIDKNHNKAELGYWIGFPYWNNGYCTEASRAMIAHAFNVLHLNRVFARHIARNPASGRVMEKAGMKYEGLLRQDMKKGKKYEDLKVYSIIRNEFEN